MFDVYNEETCYWAGFLAADGYIRPNRATVHIKLGLKDKDHLVKFSKFVNKPESIKERTNYCSIDISGKALKENLSTWFKVIPNKSKILEFPDIPEDMYPHYIRGFMDGDGSITLTTCPTVGFTCASPAFGDKIKSIFYDLGVRLKSGNKYPPTSKAYGIVYSGKNAKIILDWLYKDSTPFTRMDRKYNKYKELF